MTVNATIIEKGTLVTLEASGAAIASNSIAQADDANYSIFTNGGARPNGRFIASFTFATAPIEGAILSLYARPLDLISTNDAEVPETTRSIWIGNFAVNNVTTTQYAELYAESLPWNAAYYVHNNGTGQTVSAGWTLGVEPYTYAPATA